MESGKLYSIKKKMRLKEYNSFENKDIWFHNRHTINNTEDLGQFLESIDSLNVEPNIFRGINNAKYKLFNSAQRIWITHELNKKFETYTSFLESFIDAFKNENVVIEKFFKKFNIPLEEIPLLAYMQHYGAPTPLLDFTRDLNVALYFAVDGIDHQPGEGIENYFSIYLMKEIEELSFNKKFVEAVDKLDNVNLGNLGKRQKEMEVFVTKMKEEMLGRSLMLENFNNYAPERISESEIVNVNYYTESNLNILNQQGLFVINTLAYTPLEEAFVIYKALMVSKKEKAVVSRDEGELNLSKSADFLIEKLNFPMINYFTCFDIHKSYKERILSYLKSKGIDSDYIYPDPKKMIANSLKNTLK